MFKTYSHFNFLGFSDMDDPDDKHQNAIQNDGSELMVIFNSNFSDFI